MRSNKDWLMVIGGGLWISADKNKDSFSWANKNYFVHP